jgi:hypothetical protein
MGPVVLERAVTRGCCGAATNRSGEMAGTCTVDRRGTASLQRGRTDENVKAFPRRNRMCEENKKKKNAFPSF